MSHDYYSSDEDERANLYSYNIGHRGALLSNLAKDRIYRSCMPSRCARGYSCCSRPEYRDDEIYLPSYMPPIIDPADWRYYLLAGGMRIAFPLSLSHQEMMFFINRLYNLGPRSINYVRRGDTYVPGWLIAEDQQALLDIGPVVN